MQEDTANGRLVELFSEPMFGLYYVATWSGPTRPAVKTFVDWLLSHAEIVEF